MAPASLMIHAGLDVLDLPPLSEILEVFFYVQSGVKVESQAEECLHPSLIFRILSSMESGLFELRGGKPFLHTHDSPHLCFTARGFLGIFFCSRNN